MGFMGKIKQLLGIGGVKVKCQTNSTSLSSSGGSVGGTIQLTSKSDQQITKVTAKVVERWSTGRGAEKKTKEFDLGSAVVASDLAIKAGEEKSLPFEVNYTVSQSLNDRLKAKGGVVGALGKLGAMADAEKSEFEVRAQAQVKGTAMSSNHSTPMKMT